jgi:hypothetical protein
MTDGPLDGSQLHLAGHKRFASACQSWPWPRWGWLAAGRSRLRGRRAQRHRASYDGARTARRGVRPTAARRLAPPSLCSEDPTAVHAVLSPYEQGRTRRGTTWGHWRRTRPARKAPLGTSGSCRPPRSSASARSKPTFSTRSTRWRRPQRQRRRGGFPTSRSWKSPRPGSRATSCRPRTTRPHLRETTPGSTAKREREQHRSGRAMFQPHARGDRRRHRATGRGADARRFIRHEAADRLW